MANRVIRSPSFRRGSKRQTEWGICSVPTGYSAIGAGAKVVLVGVPAATLSPESPATVVRIRGLLSVAPTNSSANRDLVGAFGMGFVNEVAFQVGITGVPGPATDCSWGGWMVWQPIVSSLQVTTDVGYQSRFDTAYTIDSKAMRKFEEEMAFVVVVENLTGLSFSAAIAFRALVKAG